MKKWICLFLLLLACAPGTPEDHFLKVMNKTISILERHKNDPPEAAAELSRYYQTNQKELTGLVRELKSMNSTLSEEEYNHFLTRMEPVILKMKKLIIEHPTLLTHPGVEDFFTALGIGL